LLEVRLEVLTLILALAVAVVQLSLQLILMRLVAFQADTETLAAVEQFLVLAVMVFIALAVEAVEQPQLE
jgi:hypothetical protein